MMKNPVFYGLLNFLLVIILLNGPTVFAQVGVHTDFPDSSSALDIYATNKGLLIPRIILTADLSSPSPVTSPATGLLVFNSGANQSLGFYYWNGSTWVLIGSDSSGSDYWSLTGNAGTTVGTNFIGTTDAEDFALYTNDSSRMRITTAGNIVIGGTTPTYSTDLFTVFGKPGQDFAINAYSPNIGVYSEGSYSALKAVGGLFGLYALADTAPTGSAIYAKNLDIDGNGIKTIGSNTATFTVSGHSAGLVSFGNDGLISVGRGSSGIGMMVAGNNQSPVSVAGAGGTFYGAVGLYGKSNNASGTGIIGIGNNGTNYTLTDGSGGAFTGYHGLYARATNTSGTGVIGLGNNTTTPALITTGSGGAFVGKDGVYGKATLTSGIGVVGVGSNLSTGYGIITGGCGGSFAGYHGLLAMSADATAGTGVIGAGNNGSYATIAIGSGGAFTGTLCGVYGYATNTANDRYGGYFSTGGGLYAYVGCRYSGTDRKIVGTGTVSTIVKNTKGEIITLVCPEAPESLFQDYGMGQLVNGKAQIVIDPDLAINIDVSIDHPLKVFITPEGDCNGIYVTNKSANGFDVIELQGGKSSVPFSWQIVATRANEEFVMRDGTIEVSDYSKRFQPAPGPLELNEENVDPTTSNKLEQGSAKVIQVIEQPVVVIDEPVEELSPNGHSGGKDEK